MRVFTVRIEERRVRHQRVVAATEDEARRAAALLLRGSDRILSANLEAGQVKGPRDGFDARDALDQLLGTDFLDLDGKPMLVADWLQAARNPARRADLNRFLAMAGLRLLEDDRLAVGSAASIPTLNEWFGGTAYAGAHLLATLDAIPGTSRAVLTFAGVRARAVILPAAEVFSPETFAE